MLISTPFRQKLMVAGFEWMKALVFGSTTNAGRPLTCPIAAVTLFKSFSATNARK